MVMDNIVGDVPQELISKISEVVSVLQALGIVIILYLIFNVINTILNKRRVKETQKINKNLLDIKKLLSKRK